MVDKSTEIAEVSEDVYMHEYAAEFYEWVGGVLIKMTPVSARHDGLTRFLDRLIGGYLDLTNLGQIRSAPFVMRVGKSRREPDLQVILNDNPGELTDTYMDGPADICIEIVSPSNEAVDYGDKFREYEQAGVREYWIFDPMRQETRFHRLNSKGTYTQVIPEDGKYTTPLLPDFVLDVSLLWQDDLPDLFTVAQMVKDMLN